MGPSCMLPHHLVMGGRGGKVFSFFPRRCPGKVEIEHLVSTHCSSLGSRSLMSFHPTLTPLSAPQYPGARRLNGGFQSLPRGEGWTHISWVETFSELKSSFAGAARICKERQPWERLPPLARSRCCSGRSRVVWTEKSLDAPQFFPGQCRCTSSRGRARCESSGQLELLPSLLGRRAFLERERRDVEVEEAA